MKEKLIKFLNNKFLFLLIFTINEPFLMPKIKASDFKTQPSSEYLRNIPKNQYILGIGDELTLQVSENTQEFNTQFKIEGDGTVYLKRLNKVYVSGLTIDELTNILNVEYSKYVIEPNVKLNLIKYRPVKFYVDGEVNKPGLHILPGLLSTFDINRTEQSQVNLLDLPGTFPSLTDALKKSGGLTIYSELNSIKVIRNNSVSNGGGKIKAEINLINFFDSNDFSQNIRIYDGDFIIVEKNQNPVPEQISKAIKSNINPSFINVAVSGRVNKGGVFKVNKSSVLVDAIQRSGGTKYLKGQVIFLRYNNDGTVENRKFRYNQKSKRGSYKNPYLQDGDVIFVGKSPFNVTSEVITELTSPFQGLFSAYGLYKAIADD